MWNEMITWGKHRYTRCHGGSWWHKSGTPLCRVETFHNSWRVYRIAEILAKRDRPSSRPTGIVLSPPYNWSRKTVNCRMAYSHHSENVFPLNSFKCNRIPFLNFPLCKYHAYLLRFDTLKYFSWNFQLDIIPKMLISQNCWQSLVCL